MKAEKDIHIESTTTPEMVVVEPVQITESQLEESDGKAKLRKWLNMNMRIEMTDGRILIGVFLCTDRDANVILGACSEYLKTSEGDDEEPRALGLVMVPGRHIVSMHLDSVYKYS